MTLEQLAPYARTILLLALGAGALLGGVAATLVVEACIAYGRRPS